MVQLWVIKSNFFQPNGAGGAGGGVDGDGAGGFPVGLLFPVVRW